MNEKEKKKKKKEKENLLSHASNSYNQKYSQRDYLLIQSRPSHFRSRDKDVGHTMNSTIADNHMLHANFMAVYFIEPELLPIEVLHCGNKDFYVFVPVTLTLTR